MKKGSKKRGPSLSWKALTVLCLLCWYLSNEVIIGTHSLSWTSQLLSVLLASEEEIQTRSKAIESHWSPDKYQDKSSGKIEFSSFKIDITLYNKCTVNSKWFDKETLYTFRAWKILNSSLSLIWASSSHIKFVLLIWATTCVCTCLF